MAAPDVRAASARIVLLVAAFVLAGGVSGAPHPSHSASPSEDAPPTEAARVSATSAGDAAGEEGDVDWREYADALRGVLCPLDANFLSCVERRVVCELKSTVRKLSNFSDAQPWLKYVEENISDKSTSDGDGCDPESQERGALTYARDTSDSVANKDDPGIPSDTGASSQDVAHNSSQSYTTETIPRTLKMSMMMPMMLLGPMMMLGFLPFQLANLKGMVMMAMMLSNMALMSAIMTTIRNVVFGRRPGPHVVYKNYGYANEQKQKWIPHQPTVFHHG
ncbi:uncharacterized protein LOC126249544 [Schistocerca nitens]|uniref:uncharacterized protein LOC126249544 n=1 Tax=Schistocerca nitens TaxID=7011 RepID=UPI00211857CA|nr:uncharacterized protein LOC126249544 [Schistocerca nitens]